MFKICLFLEKMIFLIIKYLFDKMFFFWKSTFWIILLKICFFLEKRNFWSLSTFFNKKYLFGKVLFDQKNKTLFFWIIVILCFFNTYLKKVLFEEKITILNKISPSKKILWIYFLFYSRMPPDIIPSYPRRKSCRVCK